MNQKNACEMSVAMATVIEIELVLPPNSHRQLLKQRDQIRLYWPNYTSW
jgi:hypothetical protein